MEYTPGQLVRILDHDGIPDHARGRLGVVVEKGSKKHKEYIVSMMSLTFPVKEIDLLTGPEDMVH